MNLNISYDTNTINTAPSQFYSAVNYVVGLFDSLFTPNVTVNIEVGYGEFPADGSAVPALGESEQTHDLIANYNQVRQTLVNEGTPGSSTLPLTSPDLGNLILPSAQEKALGLMGANSGLDGYVGIASSQTMLRETGDDWSYSPTSTPAATQYYVVGALEHEISEVMGRTSFLSEPNAYGIDDLYRYAVPGVYQTGTGGPSYFSIDGGQTNLDTWNNADTTPGDLGDWAASAGADAFLNNGVRGQIDGITQTDLILMSAIGWHVAPTVDAVTTISLAENASFVAPSFATAISNPGGDILNFIYQDYGGGSGYFTVNGVRQNDNTLVDPVAGSVVQYVAGPSAGVDNIQFLVYDASTNTYPYNFTIDAVTKARTVVSDFDGNGLSDILWRNTSTGDTETWLTNAPGGYTYANDGAPSVDWQIAGTGDFNGYGFADILWRNTSSGDTELYASNGSGGFTYQDLGVVGTGWQIAGIDDFSGDGLADVLWQNTNGALELWGAKSGGGFNYASLGSAPSGWQVVGTGDFNGDGSADILWRNLSSGAAETWLTNASGGFSYVNDGAPASTWQVAGVGDFNGDNHADILWRNATSGDAYLYLSNGSGGFNYQDLGIVPTAWQVAQIGDFNGDGTSDILWRNASTGDDELWLTKAGGGFTYQNAGNVSPNWTIAHTA